MKQRIEYIDALRGFTMILVVFAHLEGFCLLKEGFGSLTPLNSLFQSFRMPLFFFVSGFIAFKTTSHGRGGERFFRASIKKAKVIIPTLFFGLIYTYLYIDKDLNFFITDAAKGGYWFTLVLLEIFIIYYIVNLLLPLQGNVEKSRLVDKWTIALICLSIFLYLIKLPLKLNPTLQLFGDITSLHYTCEYFQFFSFGLLSARYSKVTTNILGNSKLCAITIISFFTLWYIKTYYIVPHETFSIDYWKITATVFDSLTGYLGILTIFGCFRKYQNYLSTATKVGRLLSFIGRRTLDIYLLHYFFLSPMPSIGAWLEKNPNIVVELSTGLILSLLIIGCCLLISQLLRTSNFLAQWLFGAKKTILPDTHKHITT